MIVPSRGGGGGGVTAHSALTELDYASAGHTGFAGTGIANTFAAAQMVDGAADAIQLRVQGNATQTSNLQTWEQSDGTVVGSVSNGGTLAVLGPTPTLHLGDGSHSGKIVCADNRYMCLYGGAGGGSPFLYLEGRLAGGGGGEVFLSGGKNQHNYTVHTMTVRARGAYATATIAAYKIGGALNIYAGEGDGAAGQTAAHGGNLQLHGGNAASDLDSSNGGDVLIYGGTLGTNGTPGVDGSVRITDADGSTNRIEVDQTGIGFFAHAPVAQLAKADYNNWAAFGDVVDALVAIGLFDAA